MTAGRTVLVIDDEPPIRRLLRLTLEPQGYRVFEADNGQLGLQEAAARRPDVIVLDLGLPDMDGLTVLKRLREWSQTPVLVLSVRDRETDKVAALDNGADDYLTKPFSFEVLAARVRAAGRRGPIPQPVCLEAAGLIMNQSTHEVRRGGRRIELTRTEFAILEVLMRNAGRVVVRDTLIEAVWGSASDIESNTLDAFVRLLRAKIEQPGLIRTVRGVGYSLQPEAE